MAKRSKKRRKVADAGISRTIAEPVADIQQLPSWFSRDWPWGLILLAAVILAYSPVWWAGYIWDDDVFVTANPCIIGPFGLKEIWTTGAADICPLTLTTVWAEHALWGLAPLPYHLVNVLFHGAGAIVLWRVLRSLQVPGAWLGAALWALHPVQVESVAWITETKNTESGLFFLLSILFFVRWLRSQDSGVRTGDGWNYGLTLLFAALAMASKSSTVILPVVLCLCAWWTEGRWRWRNLIHAGPIFLMSVAWGVLSICWMQKLRDSSNSQWQTWPDRLVTAGDAVWFYLGKLIWPHPLIAIYPRWHIDAGHWASYLPMLAAIIALWILWFKRKSWARPWFFALAYFLVALLPVLGFVQMIFFRYSFVADHFQYLASMGPLALAGAGLVRFANEVIPGKPRLQSSLCAGLLLLLGLWSWEQAQIYNSEETLWTDTLGKNQDCWVGHNNLGLVFFEKGRVERAIAEYQKALEINPMVAEAHNNLGNAFLEKGQWDEAIFQCQQSLQINPNNAAAYYNIGLAYTQKGNLDAAISQFEKALDLAPDFSEGHNKLGNALLQKGETDAALVEYQKALEIDPNNAELHNNLGVALFKKGRKDDAIVQFQSALRLNPDSTDAKNNLLQAQAMMRQAHGAK